MGVVWRPVSLSTAVSACSDDALHLYALHWPSVSASAEATLTRSLAVSERRRARQYHHAADRRRSSLARAVLRHLLGQYAGVAPANTRLVCHASGKPYWDFGHGDAVTTHGVAHHFNVSHSGKWVVYAVARQVAVGVDIEQMRPNIRALQLAERFFHPDEVVWLKTLSPQACHAAFYSLWVRKEAWIKAQGGNLLEGVAVYSMGEHPQAWVGGTLPRLAEGYCGAWLWQATQQPRLRCMRLIVDAVSA